jgi:hypothetical protein
MAKTETISIEVIRELVSYNPNTGELFHKPRTAKHTPRFRSFNTRLAGKAADTSRDGKGYLLVTVNNIKFKAHRIAYAIMTGSWPDTIDHINGVRGDNRWCNLRSVTQRQNRANTYGWTKTTSSKYIGVTHAKTGKPWVAQATLNRKNFFLGSFNTEVEAAKARDRFVLEHNKEHARLNFPVEKTNG